MNVSVSQLVKCPQCGHRFELSETFRAQYEQEKQAAVADAVHHMSVKAEAARAAHEARIRAEAQEQRERELVESAQREEALQEQLQANQEAQAEREARLRTELSQANQAQLAESAKQLKALQEQLQANQEAQAEREAQIREELNQQAEEQLAGSTKQLAELQEREKNLLTKLQQEQAERAQQEALIRADEKARWEEQRAIERQQEAIEKQRLERAAADAQAKMADMQRQLGQGSVELQGEALEVYLKRQLQTQFPFDQIEDIGRGQLGADLTQAVFDGQLGACGIVVWEAKRTKHWNDDWLDKIKGDADRVGSQVRVIVSQALPPEIRVFALKEGVWVSSVEGALPLATALRAQLVESARLQRAGQGKGLKMDEIYNYLTSPRFGERIQRMVDTWQALEEQVASEERAMRRQWSERRKQLARMRETTTEMFTDFSAILGREIAQVPGLELGALPPAEEASTTDPSSAWEDGGNF